MLITVAICTYNRAESLRRTLASLAAMRVPSDIEWELIVVNNNCTDHTDAVIASFAGQLPIRGEFEPKGGQSNARNRAIDVASGEYVVWTDDDVVVDPEWLDAYARAFSRRPEAAFFGGPIRPLFEEPRVEWAVASQGILGGPYCIRDLGDEALPLSPKDHRLPNGANFAVRLTEQRLFRYDPELGLTPTRHRRGDEHAVIEQMLEAGLIGYPVREARVEHCIGHERQTISYLKLFYTGAGDEDAFVQHSRGRDMGPLIFGVPRWLWRGLIEGWVLYHVLRPFSPGPVWVRHLKTYAYARGAIRYWRSEAKKIAVP